MAYPSVYFTNFVRLIRKAISNSFVQELKIVIRDKRATFVRDFDGTRRSSLKVSIINDNHEYNHQTYSQNMKS